MKFLKKINERMRDELDIRQDSEENEESAETEAEEEKEEKVKTRSRVRIETASKIVGIIRNVEYSVKYKELSERIRDEISGISVSRDKARQIFQIVKDMVGF